MPSSVVLDVDGLEVEVTFRRVRRMNVRVHPPDASVRLSVPPRTSQRSVVRFVRDSRDWIEHHRARILEEERRASQRPTPRPLRGISGETWWHFGHAHRLDVEAVPDPTSVVLRPDRRLLVRTRDPGVAGVVLGALDRWQRQELRRAAQRILDPWATRLDVQYEFLGLRRMVTRWGSCVPQRRRIWLNVALVTRPPALLEYVAVHELAHLIEPSHGPAFRAVMDAHLPDWRERRTALDVGAVR